jgi:heat-inducible transcriptional repressor
MLPMRPTSDLNLRARKILSAVVSEYLQTGEAVGSRTITRRHGIHLSAATVRNVMADLEEMGLLNQPHTSAGRLPTEAGLRFYIDSLLKVRSLSPGEKEEICKRYGEDPRDLDEIMQRTSRMLSEITTHAGLVLTPLPERQRFQHVEFIQLKDGTIIGVLVTTGGTIENKLLGRNLQVDERQLERIHNYLDELLGGLTLDEVRARVVEEMAKEKNQYDDMVSAALRLGHAALFNHSAANVIVSGKANLLDQTLTQDAQRLERMRDLLQALEDKDVLIRLLDQTLTGQGIQVFLGAETALAALSETSVVAMPYGDGDRPLGAIAVIGPRRMNYGKIMSVVDFTATLVTRLLHGGD